MPLLQLVKKRHWKRFTKIAKYALHPPYWVSIYTTKDTLKDSKSNLNHNF